MARSSSTVRGAFAVLAALYWITPAPAEAKIPTCTQFRERLTRAENIFGVPVPRFRFRDLDEPGQEIGEDHEFAIENAKGIDGQLSCRRKNGQFSSLQISVVTLDQDETKESIQAVSRFLTSVLVMAWAYTEWPKAKVQTVVARLIKDANREAEKSEIRGDEVTQGRSNFEVNKDVSLKYLVGGGLTFMIDASVAEETPKP